MIQLSKAFLLFAALCRMASASGPAPPGNYVLTEIATSGPSFWSPPINTSGQVVGWNFLWIPVSANAPVGSLVPFSGGGLGTAIDDRGQIVGASLGPQGMLPFLWTPDTPNASSGTSVAIPAPPGVSSLNMTMSINSYGQVIGSDDSGLSFFWTPSTPNGTTGTLNPDSRFNGVTRINDFGQVTLNPVPRAGNTPTLFTPTADR